MRDDKSYFCWRRSSTTGIEMMTSQISGNPRIYYRCKKNIFENEGKIFKKLKKLEVILRSGNCRS